MWKITPEFALYYVKYNAVLIGTLPPKSNASKSTNRIFEIWWWTSLTNLIFIIVPLIYSSFVMKNEPLKSIKFLFLALNAIQCVFRMIICKLRCHQFQFLYEEIETCLNNAEFHEKNVFVNYIKKYGAPYVFITFGALTAATSVVTGALFNDQPLPIDVQYPFTVDYHPIVDILYVLQIINGFQVGSITAVDIQVALLLWFSVARLNILGDEIKTASDISQLRIFIKKHQYLLWLIDLIIDTIRPIILTTIITSMLAIILGSTHIFVDDIVIKLQCLYTASILTFMVYMNAYPAEHLIRACENIGWSAWSAYDSLKIKKSHSFNQCLIFIIHKAQRPTMIKCPGILAGLSLDYYRAFLAKTFSFFTTLRILLGKVDEGI